MVAPFRKLGSQIHLSDVFRLPVPSTAVAETKRDTTPPPITDPRTSPTVPWDVSAGGRERRRPAGQTATFEKSALATQQRQFDLLEL